MKGLTPRLYNILFHTHTISGITISALLFVIFFAGMISLFKQEIYQWENPESRIAVVDRINYEQLIQRLDALQPGIKEADEIGVKLPTYNRPVYTLYVPSVDSVTNEYHTFIYYPNNHKIEQPDLGNGSTIGETLYRLHFFDQIPAHIGRYIAGFVALFSAFALVTGILIHWKNLKNKFYAFSFKQTKKQFWKNAHTVFGVIGLPFQFMYAITGAFYLMSVIILAPAVMVLFKGDQNKLIKMMYPPEAFHSHGSPSQAASHIPIADGIQRIRNDYPENHISYLQIIEPNRSDAAISADLMNDNTFNKNGVVVMDLHTGAYKLSILPGQKNYVQSILQGINNLHFGSYGGVLIKIFYFILSMFSCFVIISGVLIWKEARNKPTYTDKQRQFHHQVTILYLAICFSLFPATGLLFIFEHLIPPVSQHAHYVNYIFFAGWFIFALLSWLQKTEKKITALCLFSGGILACFVPIVNGFFTGDWLWNTFDVLPNVFYTDVIGLTTGLLTLSLWFAMRRK